MYALEVYSLMSFDKFIYPCNHHYISNVKHFLHLRKLSLLLPSQSPFLPAPVPIPGNYSATFCLS